MGGSQHKELRQREKLKTDFEFYARNCLSIRTKAGALKPFVLSKTQQYVLERLEEQRKATGKVRAIVLKARQMGLSTFIGGRYYWRVTHNKGVRAFILTHEQASTEALFEMTERYHENAPHFIKPSTGASNARELIFNKLDSGYKVGTAGNKAVGRGTTVQYFHGSEVGFWPNAAEHAKGILQAVPDEPDTEVILESTANGIGNYFHQQWQKAEAGESEFIAIFVPWFWQTEYRKAVPTEFRRSAEEQALVEVFGLDDEQLMFRRFKVAELSVDGLDGESAFKQEYPMTATEAFQTTGGDTLIKPTEVVKARQYKTLASGPLIIGVDPARFGDDRTAIIKRRSRVAYDLMTFSKADTMEVAGIVAAMIKSDKPAQVAIDVGGLGAGVVDRLIELGHGDIVLPVNFGSTALDPQVYKNKRAEMWWEMRNWLAGDMPVMIPNKDELHADLCGPTYKYDSNQRRQLESKDDMKRRGLRSSDCADALALTFNGEPLHDPKEYQIDAVPVIDRAAGY